MAKIFYQPFLLPPPHQHGLKYQAIDLCSILKQIQILEAK